MLLFSSPMTSLFKVDIAASMVGQRASDLQVVSRKLYTELIVPRLFLIGATEHTSPIARFKLCELQWTYNARGCCSRMNACAQWNHPLMAVPTPASVTNRTQYLQKQPIIAQWGVFVWMVTSRDNWCITVQGRLCVDDTC